MSLSIGRNVTVENIKNQTADGKSVVHKPLKTLVVLIKVVKSFSDLIWFPLGIAQMRASFQAEGKYKFLMQVLMTSVSGDPR